MHRFLRISVCLLASLTWCAASVEAQDTCDVTVQLEAAGPLAIVAFAIDYSGAGGDFVGDSTAPGSGPSWGAEALACTPAMPVFEFTAVDDNAGTLSMFFATLGPGFSGPVELVSCVFTPSGGFPCPPAEDFAVADAQLPDDPFPPPFPIPSPPALTLLVSERIPLCGDGFQEGTEQCDDGNTADGDCCSSTCEPDAAGTPCPDSSVCTLNETCDGAGVCVIGNVLDCDDGVFCTYDRCDGTAGCLSDPIPADPHDCSSWEAGRLGIRDSASAEGDERMKLTLLLHGGEIGDPSDTTTYALCLFDHVAGQSVLVEQIEIPAGAPWSPKGSGFGYVDSAGSVEGIKKAILKSQSSGQNAKLVIKANGANMTLPGGYDDDGYLALEPEVVVQIENSEGGCWSNSFDPSEAPVINDPARFIAKRN